MSDSRVFREQNRIAIQGQFLMSDLLRPLVGIHQAVNQAGYIDFVLDFSECTAAFAGPMLALCAQVMRWRNSGIDVDLVLPNDPKLVRLFRNANWAYFLQPRHNPPSEFKGYSQVPATQFTNADEQQKAVNRIVNAILGAIPHLERRELSALEWSVNEITDNVLNHAQSPIGGLVQVSTFQKAKKRVEYIVVDAGVGIPATLRSTHPHLLSDVAALEQVIREGVTRDKSFGQGNGLFGSYRICSQSKGSFQVESGYGKLFFSERAGLRITRETIPFNGTLVAAQINLSVPRLLEEALQFGGQMHIPVDFVETRYEQKDVEDVIFELCNESASFGSRIAGTPVRNRLANLARMCPTQRVVIDFADVYLVSSSFADEVIGKLFVEFGPLAFMQRFELRNVEPTVRQLVDKAIAQRLATGR